MKGEALDEYLVRTISDIEEIEKAPVTQRIQARNTYEMLRLGGSIDPDKVAIHYMAFPRAGIGSRSYEKAVAVWCAADPQMAMTEAKLGGEPEPDQCDNPVAKQYQAGVELGVTGTPALLTASGQLIPGYVPPEKLRERLDQMAAAETEPTE